MGTKLGYLMISIGTVLAFGGTFQIIRNIEATNMALLWGALGVFGMFVASRGIISVMATPGDEEAVDPNSAIGKTDSRFGRG